MDHYEQLRSAWHEYRFVPGDLPVTSWAGAAISVLSYVVCVKLLQRVMAKREPVKFTGPLHIFTLAHNWFLALLSLFMGLAICRELYETYVRHGHEVLFCDRDTQLSRGPIIFFLYIFYLSKYYELLDTFILVLKKKPVIFLHIYHHFITLLLTYVMLSTEVVMQWICILTNCFVHVFMYSYYAGREHGWHNLCDQFKQWVTRVQIVQFVLDLVLIGYAMTWQIGSGGQCSGPMWAWVFGCSVIASFLLLFIQFYIVSYFTNKRVEHKVEKNGNHTNGKTLSNGKTLVNGSATKRTAKLRKED